MSSCSQPAPNPDRIRKQITTTLTNMGASSANRAALLNLIDQYVDLKSGEVPQNLTVLDRVLNS